MQTNPEVKLYQSIGMNILLKHQPLTKAFEKLKAYGDGRKSWWQMFVARAVCCSLVRQTSSWLSFREGKMVYLPQPAHQLEISCKVEGWREAHRKETLFILVVRQTTVAISKTRLMKTSLSKVLWSLWWTGWTVRGWPTFHLTSTSGHPQGLDIDKIMMHLSDTFNSWDYRQGWILLKSKNRCGRGFPLYWLVLDFEFEVFTQF